MPSRLSRAALDRARHFVAAKGRLLDAVLLQHALGEGSMADALVALAPYQNDDGGFGHGLEPDLLADLEARMLATVQATARLDGAYDLMAAWRLAETDALPAPLGAALIRLLEVSLAAIAPDDPHVNYLELAPPATGPLAPLTAARFARAVEAAIAGQRPDGHWAPFWSWEAVSAAGWFAAEADWKSGLTRHTIEVLAAQGRIDPA